MRSPQKVPKSGFSSASSFFSNVSAFFNTPKAAPFSSGFAIVAAEVSPPLCLPADTAPLPFLLLDCKLFGPEDGSDFED